MKLNKKKGFTLIELMTTIACAAVLMGILGSSVYFLMKLNGKTLSSASSNYKALMIEDFIRKNNCNSFSNSAKPEEYGKEDLHYLNKNLYDTRGDNNTLIVENIQDLFIDFDDVFDGFKKCTITYTNLLGNELVLSFLVDA